MFDLSLFGDAVTHLQTSGYNDIIAGAIKRWHTDRIRHIESRLQWLGAEWVLKSIAEGWAMMEGPAEINTADMKMTFNKPAWFVPPEAIVDGMVDWSVVEHRGHRLA